MAHRKNEQDNEDYPYEIILPDGFKAVGCFCTTDMGCVVFIDAVKDGKHKMFSFGDMHRGCGNNDSDYTMKLPEGIYLTKIENHSARK